MKPAFVIALLVLLGSRCADSGESEPELQVAVKTAAARVETVEETVRAPATVFPLSEAKVASQLTAPIERLEARKGDRVRKGATLAVLARGDMEAQRAEALAQAAAARAALERVKTGALPTDIERARGEVENAAAALAEAEKIYERRGQLFKEGAIPERQLLVSKTRFEQARTGRRVAGKTLDLLLNRSQELDIRMAESRFEQAEARLAYWDVRLGYAELTSPFDGVITEQFLYPGDMAKPDAPVFTVMDLSVAVVRAQVPEESARALRNGQACRFEQLDSLDGRFAGSITLVSHAVDAARRTLEVWCEIPNRDGALKAGVFGEMIVVVEVRPRAVTVPLAAVHFDAMQFDEGRPSGTLWTIGDDGLCRQRTVRTGVVSVGRVEILEGLNPGETVVVGAGFGLRDGLRVRAEPAGEEIAR